MRIRTFVVSVLAFSLAACSALALGSLEVIRGDGQVRLESRDAPSFTGIENQGSGLVRFSQGAARQVTVEADANILPYVETEVRGGVLVLRTRPGVSVSPTRLVFRITAPDLSYAAIAGSGGFRLDTPVATGAFEVRIGGSGGFDGTVTAGNVAAGIYGSGGVRLDGSARTVRFEIDGSGGIDAAGLPCVDARVVIRGSGSVALQATGTLDVDIAGSGDVRYRGSPRLTVRGTGSGRVTGF